MSADDTWVVSRVHDKKLWGVYHIMADGPDTSAWYNIENAVWVFSNPLDAIIQGNECNHANYAEYGCHVNSGVLRDLKDFYELNTNNIVKYPKGA